jgi:hypothetical protein
MQGTMWTMKVPSCPVLPRALTRDELLARPVVEPSCTHNSSAYSSAHHTPAVEHHWQASLPGVTLWPAGGPTTISLPARALARRAIFIARSATVSAAAAAHAFPFLLYRAHSAPAARPLVECWRSILAASAELVVSQRCLPGHKLPHTRTWLFLPVPFGCHIQVALGGCHYTTAL